MKFLTDPNLRRDLIKLGFLAGAIAATAAIFLVNPTLSSPSFLALVGALLLSPGVSWLERRGLTRVQATILLFVASAGILTGLTIYATQTIQSEWDAFRLKAPELFHAGIERLRMFENQVKQRIPMLASTEPTKAILEWGESTGLWFVENGATLAGSLATWILMAPFLTFVLLTEGLQMRRRFYSLVPNRYFESFFLVTNDILTSISDYLRAKLLEALLVGLITGIGLWAVGAPYALVLATVAGVTNILPYIGPILGAVPGILVAMFDPNGASLLLPIGLTYIIANAVDTIVIFPLIVAKLVNLHPLILIAAVIVGQQYYGLVGMLLSIPLAASMKIILQQMHRSVYEHGGSRSSIAVTWENRTAPQVQQTVQELQPQPRAKISPATRPSRKPKVSRQKK